MASPHTCPGQKHETATQLSGRWVTQEVMQAGVYFGKALHTHKKTSRRTESNTSQQNSSGFWI